MVSYRRSAEESLIVLAPNRSADWRANRWLITLVGLHALLTGAGFALAGAWMILPLAGLELLLLAAVLHRVNRRCTRRQVIRVGREALVVEDGFGRPQQHWRCATGCAVVSVHAAPYPNDPPRIALCAGSEEVGLGPFLGRDEGELLLARLRDCGLRVRDHGAAGARRF